MRKDVAVLMVLWVMCIPYATFICASATPNKLDTLKAFLRKERLKRQKIAKSSICFEFQVVVAVVGFKWHRRGNAKNAD